MKARFLLFPAFFLFFFVGVRAQAVDSMAVVREVDSLIQVSRTLTGKREFDRALEVNAVAEKIALEKFGRESASYGSVCFNHGRVLYFKGDFPGAEKWYLESKAIREQVLGKEHADYAWSLNNLANLYSDMGNYEKAELFHLEALVIREKTLGKEHSDYAKSLNNLALLYWKMSNYEKAEPLYLEALAIRENTLGKEHSDYVSNLNDLANLYLDLSNYEKAEPLFVEALTVWEKTVGKKHIYYALGLNNLALLYKSIGNYEKAQTLYLESLSIFEQVSGKEHPYYAHCQLDLANLYSNMGNYEKAQPLYVEALAIRGKILGKGHPEYALSLQNLAVLYKRMGNYEKAEPLYLESLNTFEKALGKEHPDYAWSLNNLASLYLDMGNYEKAQPLYVEALTVYEKVLGKDHPEYALSLTGLANVYWEMDNYEKAKPLYLEALVIREKVLGKVHPEYARSLSNLALLYKSMGNNEKAELYYLEALTIKEKVLGKEHPDYALNLNNLANLYSSMGNYQKAEPLFVEALVIREKTLGKEHPDYSMNLNNLVVLYWSVGNFDTVKPYLSESATIEKKLLLKASRQLSERELSKYINTFTGRQNRELSFSQLRGGVSPICYDNILFHKGFMLNTVSQVSKLALSDSVTTEKYYLLKSYHRRLATQYILPIAERDSTLIATLEEKANTLEKELVRTVAGFGEALRQVNWQEVQSQLKPQEAAIEFVHFRYSTPDPTDSTLYAALVLLPAEASLPAGAWQAGAKEGSAAPRWVYLFEQRQLDALLASPNPENRIYNPAKPSVFVAADEPPALYDLVWAPLDSLLDGVKTVYYSPSGLLHRLNLGAIPVSERQTLADRYALRQVNSTRELVVPTQVASATLDAVVYGGVRYEMDSTAIRTAFVKKDSSTAKSSSELSFSYIDRNLRNGRRSRSEGRDDSWSYLPGTEKETSEISKLLNKKGFRTIVKTGFAASEEAFKQIGRDGEPSPKVLHIATHGFFFPDPKDTIRKQQSTFRNQEPAFKVSDHPLIRSGLILAGGNATWTSQPRPADMEDGILTAYEISQMNLRNTELVVLSACETGLGDIEGNEGVYGLQRAFKIAGAKYLLMSLWKVPDEQTQELMTAFYREWTGGKAIPEAFRSAQAVMRKKYPGQPVMWAGFILVE